MTRRDVFEEAGGFDERFPIDFNDVDYCLRLRQRRLPRRLHAVGAALSSRIRELRHRAGRTMPRSPRCARRWGAIIDNDPFYNPNLTRDFPDYRLDA